MKLLLSMVLLGTSLCLSTAILVEEFCVTDVDDTDNVICGDCCLLTDGCDVDVIDLPESSYIYNASGICLDGKRLCGQCCLSMFNPDCMGQSNGSAPMPPATTHAVPPATTHAPPATTRAPPATTHAPPATTHAGPVAPATTRAPPATTHAGPVAPATTHAPPATTHAVPPTTAVEIAAIPSGAPFMSQFPLKTNGVVGNVRILLFCSPSRQQLSWATAQSYCESVGYKLGQFNSPALANAIMQMSASDSNDYDTNGCTFPWVGGAWNGHEYIWTATNEVVTGPFIHNEPLQYTTNRPNLYWNGYWKGLNNYDLLFNGAPMMGFTCTSH